MGDVVLALILEKYGLTPEIRVNPSDILVVTFDEDLLPHALTLATELRSAGFKVEWYPLSDRISKQFRYANKQDIPLVAILGPDEMNQHQVTIKDMRSRKQETINRDALIDHVAALLEPPELS
jgi:histidyl-tRNA synthetase